MIHEAFTQDDFERFIYFERVYRSVSGVLPGTDPALHYAITFADDLDTVAITYRDDALAGLNWVQVVVLQPDHPAARATYTHAWTAFRPACPRTAGRTCRRSPGRRR